MGNISYKNAGVDIDEGALLVDLIKPAVRSTQRTGVIGGIGGFGGLFSARFKGLNDPVLVSATDGVGTKLKIAFMADRHDTVGIDLVAMSVNDILVSGAEPLFFLDYLATGKLSAKKHSEVVKGVARGCKESGCALLGGETAEMPGMYGSGEYDLAGFAVGVVDKKAIIDHKRVKAGDHLIGLASSGLHSNGFSLARSVLFDRMGLKVTDKVKGLGSRNLSQVLLAPTRLYVKPVLKLLKKIRPSAMVHVTGGGFQENISRVLPKGLKASVELGSWPVPNIFKIIQKGGPVEESEMLRTFNCGIGYIIIVKPKDVDSTLKSLKAEKVRAFDIGKIEKAGRGDSVVRFTGTKLF